MQTNLSYKEDDLDIITRLYRKQNKIEKAYRVTYRSAHTGKEDFVGAHDADEAEKKRREIENFGHKVQHVKVLKAKVYV